MTLQLLKYISFLITSLILCFTQIAIGQDTIETSFSVKEKLNIPFGTLAKMKVEIVDGDELQQKAFQSKFLFKILSIDSIVLPEPVILEFKDETGRFPDDYLSLYKYLYGKEKRVLTSEEFKKLEGKYVGRIFDVVAYETGAFNGVPDNYFDFQPVRQDQGFHFRHSLVVIANLTKKTD